MVNLTEQDKEYINSNKGSYTARGVIDLLVTVEKKLGIEKRSKIVEEMKMLGLDLSGIKETSIIPLTTFITLLIVKKQVLNLSDEEIYDLGREAAKLSFVLKYASRLLLSLDVICKNANVGWHKYYKTGELTVTELNKEERRIKGEVRNFTGHPIHCRYIEGYFAQMIFFVTGRETKCYEEECIFNGGSVHRYVMTF